MKKKKYFIELSLVIYGLLCALIMWKYSEGCDKELQMPARLQSMQHALDEIASGRMPDLLLYDNDQRAVYLIVPYLSYHIGGLTDAATVLRLCQNIYAFILFSVLPILCYWFTKNNFMIGIVTPPLAWIIWGRIFWKIKETPYYAIAWGATLSFFILSLLIRETRKGHILGLICAECAVICLSNLMRTGSVFLGGALLVVIVFIKEWRKNGEKGIRGSLRLRKSIVSGILFFSIVLSYVSVNVLDVGVVNAVYKSENRFFMQNVRPQPWHSLYIGLGFEENPYGIFYLDECAIAKAKEINPQVVYVSEEYQNILKEEYFKLLRADPLWAISGYVKKLVLCCINSFRGMYYTYGNVLYCRLSAIAGLAIAIYWIIRKRNDLILKLKSVENIEYIAIFIFLYFGGMVQGIMTIPKAEYLYGSMAMVGVGMLLVSIEIILKCEDILSKRKKL